MSVYTDMSHFNVLDNVKRVLDEHLDFDGKSKASMYGKPISKLVSIYTYSPL